jgi:DGQHR domain-containing protein
VRQWLPDWDKIDFGGEHQTRPKEHFYLFSLSAATLKVLSGIQRREQARGKRRAEDLGIQRRHDPDRSEEIREFVRHGFPWSVLSDRQRTSQQFDDLRKPGWLPTAIVVNMLESHDRRAGRSVGQQDVIEVRDEPDGTARLSLPAGCDSLTWVPRDLEPLEVIDGQHRLWAFQPGEFATEFELPVVAFHGLDLSWQAYLFWTINIKPKRINASLAFDLYPLLRTEDWLTRFEGPQVYRETRAQELTEILWAHTASPWYHRINMLGEPGYGGVTQAAWIRSLINSFVKAWEGPGVRIGGLFGAPVGHDELVLPWTREQQAAFLIAAWQELAQAIGHSADDWVLALRFDAPQEAESDADDDETFDTTVSNGRRLDPAFAGRFTLLNTDQGVRAFLQVVNDVCYLMADDLALRTWPTDRAEARSDLEDVTTALTDLGGQPVSAVLRDLADTLAHFDWRTSSHESLTPEQRTLKAAFRGSGGYRELRRQLLLHLQQEGSAATRAVAADVLGILKLA